MKNWRSFSALEKAVLGYEEKNTTRGDPPPLNPDVVKKKLLDNKDVPFTWIQTVTPIFKTKFSQPVRAIYIL